LKEWTIAELATAKENSETYADASSQKVKVDLMRMIEKQAAEASSRGDSFAETTNALDRRLAALDLVCVCFAILLLLSILQICETCYQMKPLYASIYFKTNASFAPIFAVRTFNNRWHHIIETSAELTKFLLSTITRAPFSFPSPPLILSLII